MFYNWEIFRLTCEWKSEWVQKKKKRLCVGESGFEYHQKHTCGLGKQHCQKKEREKFSTHENCWKILIKINLEWFVAFVDY